MESGFPGTIRCLKAAKPCISYVVFLSAVNAIIDVFFQDSAAESVREKVTPPLLICFSVKEYAVARLTVPLTKLMLKWRSLAGATPEVTAAAGMRMRTLASPTKSKEVTEGSKVTVSAELVTSKLCA